MSQPNTELDNFAAFLKQEVEDAINDPGEGGFREATFTQLVMEYLSDAGETGNTRVCTAVHRSKNGNRHRQINGYALWENYETLDVFVSDYNGGGTPYTLEKARITVDTNLALKYLNYLYKGDFEAVEDSSEEREFQQNFYAFREKVVRVRIILLTDGIIGKGIKSEIGQTGEVDVTVEIWDLERIYQIWSSQRKREPIQIDIPEQFGQKIQILSREEKKEGYTTYMGIVPGKLLADLYDKHGSRLLEQNVRVYLQNVGKVNKDIRKTILDNPGMFLAYNNGISATATALTTVKDKESGNEVLKCIRNLQIVNGGQTTSSIYYAWKKDRADLSQVYLQMKITLIQDDAKMEKIVSRISKYANSQNKVSETDLTSNQGFHITLEELSRTTWASPVTGHQQTRWYYERVRGQYREEANKVFKTSQKKAFKDRNPPQQVITKEELAKYRNAWNLFPHFVARGSQKNYLHFMETDAKLKPSRDYFRDSIAMAILFNTGEKIYGKKPNAMGDLRYLAVPYTMAWLNHYTDRKINLAQIWKSQTVPHALAKLLNNILIQVNRFLQDNKPDEYALVSEWAKRESCWLELKSYTPKDWNLDMKPAEKIFRKENSKSDSGEDNFSAVLAVTADEWELIEQKGRETGFLSPLQTGVVRNIINRLQKQKALSEQLLEMAAPVLSMYERYRKR